MKWFKKYFLFLITRIGLIEKSIHSFLHAFEKSAAWAQGWFCDDYSDVKIWELDALLMEILTCCVWVRDLQRCLRWGDHWWFSRWWLIVSFRFNGSGQAVRHVIYDISFIFQTNLSTEFDDTTWIMPYKPLSLWGAIHLIPVCHVFHFKKQLLRSSRK